jgi:hypothetical protein
MDEPKRRLDLRAAIGVFAVVLAAAALWGASALAAGGSPSGESGTGDSPAAATVQNEGDRHDGDCPERGGDAEDGSAAV